MRRPNPLHLRRARQRGIGLLDSLVALAILAMGMLAMTRFQARLIASGTDAQQRLVATQLADELLSLVMVDPDNGACYTVPAAGACSNATARAYTDAWKARAESALEQMAVNVLRDAANNRIEVTMAWTGKDGRDPREMKVVSYAR